LLAHDERFTVRSGRLNISDPLFFGDHADCAAYDLPARSGTWRVELVVGEYDRWGTRIAELRCRHDIVADDAGIDELISDDIGVDGGAVCVYDTPENLYEGWEAGEDLIVGPHGACSSSGIGDGVYTAYGRYDADELVAVRVVYIPDAKGRMPDDFGYS
jgi:hypothetical protein